MVFQRVTYSEASKTKIRAAAEQMIETLCAGNDVEADIMNTYCMKALNSKMGQKSGGKFVAKKRKWLFFVLLGV